MAKEQISREEAIQVLTMYQDLASDAETKERFIEVLADAGRAIGYAPAMRCLVMCVSPEDAIRWGK
ncbi:hypothetical protein LCGC14_2619040 [marine sediment metagenome]|uniref:Uncharacterized protein n=1 Tax=marine sediment metagenome TaxID=412755 RepID=A0A0F9A3V0_9ZZZZ